MKNQGSLKVHRRIKNRDIKKEKINLSRERFVIDLQLSFIVVKYFHCCYCISYLFMFEFLFYAIFEF